MSQPRVLYLSYDGALEPLGQSQVLPYLRGLARRGAAITLVSFEKPADLQAAPRLAALRDDLARHDIRWIPLAYHKRPTLPATLYDIAMGVARGAAVARRERIGIVHARSYVAALMAWLLKRALGLRFIFDMRGFWADERIEGGIWPADGALYKATKRLEQRFLTDADEIVALTDRARETIAVWPGINGVPVTVIPTCVDLQKFPAAQRSPSSSTRTPVVTYVGSLGTWYLLPEMFALFGEVRRRFPAARFLILTRNQREAMQEVERSGVPAEAITIDTVSSDGIAARIAQADVGLAFYKPGFARRGTCPTKIGEYLAMGLPVIANDAVGDVDRIIGPLRVGAVLSEFTPRAYAAAVDRLVDLWADPGLADRCRRVAEERFSLDAGVSRYWSIYQRLA